MKTLRADSTPVEFYNEGLVVFLYDEENAGPIREAGPTLLEGFGEADARDPALAGLARDGLLVAFELEQDDEVAIELAIGPPLTEDEAGDEWRPAGRALLVLPSGSLRVEGYNNLRLSPDRDPDEEPGAVVDVPAGRYVVSLYRPPLEPRDESDEPDEDEDAGPHHVVLLTPAGDTDPVEEPEPMLLGPRPTRALEDRTGGHARSVDPAGAGGVAVRPGREVPARPARSSPVPTRATRGCTRAVAFVPLLLFAACTDTLSRVFVPGTGYTETMRAWTEHGDTARVRVGEALVLHAERHSGPWVEVDRSSVDADACWVARDPGHEEEVAGMIGFYVNPPGAAEFGGFRADLSADVAFSRPGTYALTPASSGLCSAPYLGNVLHVIVTP